MEGLCYSLDTYQAGDLNGAANPISMLLLKPPQGWKPFIRLVLTSRTEAVTIAAQLQLIEFKTDL
jgi:hypothetical protein